MKQLHLIFMSILLFVGYQLNAMTEGKKKLITLGIIDNQRTQQGVGNFIQCLINHEEIDAVASGKQITSNTLLFNTSDRFPAIKRLALEPRPKAKGFKEFRLKLEVEQNRSHLKIIKDFGDRVHRPEEFYPLEENKKYLLNLMVKQDDKGNDEVVVDLVEDKIATTVE